MSLDDFAPERLLDRTVLATAQKVIPIQDASFDWKHELPLGRVEIVTRTGNCYALTGTNVPGSASAPMSWEDIWRKFRECNRVARAPRSAEQLIKVEQAFQTLELRTDAVEALRLLA